MEDVNVNTDCFAEIDFINFSAGVKQLSGAVASDSKLDWEPSNAFHFTMCPPTAETDLSHGMRDASLMPIEVRCCGPARHILAPLSRNIYTWAF